MRCRNRGRGGLVRIWNIEKYGNDLSQVKVGQGWNTTIGRLLRSKHRSKSAIPYSNPLQIDIQYHELCQRLATLVRADPRFVYGRHQYTVQDLYRRHCSSRRLWFLLRYSQPLTQRLSESRPSRYFFSIFQYISDKMHPMARIVDYQCDLPPQHAAGISPADHCSRRLQAWWYFFGLGLDGCRDSEEVKTAIQWRGWTAGRPVSGTAALETQDRFLVTRTASKLNCGLELGGRMFARWDSINN